MPTKYHKEKVKATPGRAWGDSGVNGVCSVVMQHLSTFILSINICLTIYVHFCKMENLIFILTSNSNFQKLGSRKVAWL